MDLPRRRLLRRIAHHLVLLRPFPEITDADMHHQEHAIAEYNPGPLRKQWTLFLGVWAQFCYVGAQVAVASYFM